ncbi:PQQ-binding-like beta-propeller repeat protein [Jiangella sp. DSM 45060]|uniref:outer membrane protein assembly factor BamB family protein n=1 Tax=Jiangella sp. DSM 45060 TaxID=1798224 RepID=UPI00087973E2|nr:PQQ-binding-like beta-propeller repeat protein [Jiangella sp. DSM 45060]SDS06105.1 PQQ-like domain-containing protein [Jiangella sp. DSM 45060]
MRHPLLAAVLVAVALPLGAAPAAAVAPAAAAAEPVPLGAPLSDVNLIGGAVATTPDGVPTVYGVTNGEPARLTAADARTGEILLTTPLPGASSSYSVITLDGGDVYISANSNGHLYRLPWGAGAVEDLGQVAPGQTFAWDITEGPDGRVYGVTYPGARLYAYDPDTREYQDYGAVAADTQQGRTIASYGGKLYVGTMTRAHLVEVDPATGDQREIALPPASDPGNDLTSVFDVNVAGDRLYVRIGTDIKYAPLYEYDPATGTWGASLDTVAGLELPAPGPDGELYVMRTNTLTAWDPATGDVTPTSLRYEGRVYNYRGAGWADLGDPEWPGLTLTGFFWRGELWRYNPRTGRGEVARTEVPGEPIEIVSLEPATGGGVWAGGFLGGFAHVDTATGASRFNRFSQTEYLYDDGDSVWVGAYPDARGYRYDPDAAFNDPDYAPGPPGTPVNPVKLWDFKQHTANPQDRVFALLPLDDVVVAATGPKGSTFGGSVAVSDRATGETRFLDDLSPDRALTSLAASADGATVYAGTWVYGGTGSPDPVQSDGTVLAFDPVSGDVRWQVTPVPGAPAYVATTVDAAGRLWTLAGSALVELDPATGATLRTVQLGDPLPSGRKTWPHQAGIVETVPGADAVYVSVGGRLYCVYGATGAAEDLGAFAYSSFTVLDDGDLAMASGPELFRWTPPAVDAAPPAVEVGVAHVDGDWRPYLELTADDGAGLGVHEIAYRLDGGPWTTYTGPVRLRPGRHLVEVRVADRAGNVASVTERLEARPAFGR